MSILLEAVILYCFSKTADCNEQDDILRPAICSFISDRKKEGEGNALPCE